MDHRPPKGAQKLLLFFIKDDFAEEVLGDLEEKYFLSLKTGSPQRARLNYWLEVLNYMRPFAFKYFRSNSIFNTMFRHNLLIGTRILLKNKLFSFINIVGLAVGITVAILIGLWIHDEFSFNKNHENFDRIVQVLRKDMDDGEVRVNSSLVGQLGIKLAEEYGHYFEEVAMTFYRPSNQLLTANANTVEDMGYYFQPSICNILTPIMISGTWDALDEVNGILISESLAEKLFNDENPMGEIVSFNVSTSLIVTGVFKDFPRNSTFGDANFFVSQHLIYNSQNPYTWDNYNIKIYGLLRENVQLADASGGIKDILNDELQLTDEPIDLLLISMRDWHLNSYFKNGEQVTSEKMKFVGLYALTGILVLLIACINFMNLNTAKYQTRVKEIGVRKAIGSYRRNLIAQFLTESALYSFAALAVSLIAVFFILPWFSYVTDKELIFPFSYIWFWIGCLAFAAFSSLIAGFYPALFLSSINPVSAERGNTKQGSVRFRQVLVIFQFTVSIVLIVGTIVVYQQLNFAKERPVGYNQDHLLTTIGRSKEFFEKYNLLKTELKNTGVVEEVASANYPLINTLGNNNAFRFKGEKVNATFNTIYTTADYGSTVDWEVVEGRDFSQELDESGSIILSESAAKIIGLDNPLGERMESPRDYNGRRTFTVIGIVKDMVKGSPFEPPVPLMVFCSEEPQRFFFIRMNKNSDYVSAINQIQQVYEEHLPGEGFNFNFVDDLYLTKFKTEEQVGNFAAFFCLLAIVICCLGLFGLSAFVVNQRVKEIGIRKILGASLFNLWSLLSKDFGILVLISCVIATPLSMNILSNWLDGYSYRIELSIWVFVVGGLACVLITLATVSYHSIKVSRANPVESLRSE